MNEIANCAVPIVTICKTGLLDDTLIHKAMSHGAIFHATCNAILLLKDVNLGKDAYSLHFANVFFTYQTVFTD